MIRAGRRTGAALRTCYPPQLSGLVVPGQGRQVSAISRWPTGVEPEQVMVRNYVVRWPPSLCRTQSGCPPGPHDNPGRDDWRRRYGWNRCSRPETATGDLR